MFLTYHSISVPNHTIFEIKSIFFVCLDGKLLSREAFVGLIFVVFSSSQWRF